MYRIEARVTFSVQLLKNKTIYNKTFLKIKMLSILLEIICFYQVARYVNNVIGERHCSILLVLDCKMQSRSQRIQLAVYVTV